MMTNNVKYMLDYLLENLEKKTSINSNDVEYFTRIEELFKIDIEYFLKVKNLLSKRILSRLDQMNINNKNFFIKEINDNIFLVPLVLNDDFFNKMNETYNIPYLVFSVSNRSLEININQCNNDVILSYIKKIAKFISDNFKLDIIR